MTLIIHATNIHSGGGAELLAAILAEIRMRGVAAVGLIDERLEIPAGRSDKLRLIEVRPTLVGRLQAERQLAGLAREEDLIFSVGNLPPLFSVRAPVCLFIQNRYLVDRVSLKGFPPRVRIRIAVERLWLRQRISRVARIMVQTPCMARQLLTCFARQAEILPFAALGFGWHLSPESAFESLPKYDFVYVASGEPHKNHVRLFEAWEILADEGIYPSLCVTLTPEDEAGLGHLLERVRLKGGVIDNVGQVPRAKVTHIYNNSRALIFPSTLESFGLPLLEAQAAGLAIVAAELDYVRDAVDPAQTFDPGSGLSISRAVKRYLGIATERERLRSPGEFLDEILRGHAG